MCLLHRNFEYTLEKEELLVMKNLLVSFSHSVMYFFENFVIFIIFKIVICKLFQFRRVKSLLFSKQLTPSQRSHGFYVSAVQVFEKHCVKRRNCSQQAIRPFPSVFLCPLGQLSSIFIKFRIVVCNLFQFGRV